MVTITEIKVFRSSFLSKNKYGLTNKLFMTHTEAQKNFQLNYMSCSAFCECVTFFMLYFLCCFFGKRKKFFIFWKIYAEENSFSAFNYSCKLLLFLCLHRYEKFLSSIFKYFCTQKHWMLSVGWEMNFNARWTVKVFLFVLFCCGVETELFILIRKIDEN